MSAFWLISLVNKALQPLQHAPIVAGGYDADLRLHLQGLSARMARMCLRGRAWRASGVGRQAIMTASCS
jgi:hypothetical protein